MSFIKLDDTFINLDNICTIHCAKDIIVHLNKPCHDYNKFTQIDTLVYRLYFNRNETNEKILEELIKK